MYTEARIKGKNILLTEVDSTTGELVATKIKDFKPALFVTGSGGELEDLTEGYSVRQIECATLKQYSDKERTWRDSEVHELHNSNYTPEYQFLKQLDTTSALPKGISPLYWYLDIETYINKGETAVDSADNASKDIILIQIANNRDDETILISSYDCYEPRDDSIKHILCENNDEVLKAFLKLHRKCNPAITVAHFGDVFDFPYIINKMKKLFPDIKDPAKMFSIHKQSTQHDIVMFGGDKKQLNKPMGNVWLDFLEVYKYVTFGSRESWAIDYLAKYELGEGVGKVPFEELGFSGIGDLTEQKYTREYDDEVDSPRKKAYDDGDDALLYKLCVDVLMDYGIEDVKLLKMLDKKLGALDRMMNITMTFRCNMYDILGTVKPWMILLTATALKQGKVMPSSSKNEEYSIPGGHVFALPGQHNDVIIEDYTSLYPFIIMDLCLSPENHIPRDELPEEIFKQVHDRLVMREEAKPFIVDKKIKLKDPFRPDEGGMSAIDFDVISETRKNVEDKMILVMANLGSKITPLLEKHNMVMAPNGTFWKKNPNAILPSLVWEIYSSRNEDKAKIKQLFKRIDSEELTKDEIADIEHKIAVLGVAEQGKKILINSLYGMVASNYSVLASSDLGAAITAAGRYNIKMMAEHIKSYVGDGVYITLKDTDSFHLSMSSIVPKELVAPVDRVKWLYDYTTEHISPEINMYSKKISDSFNGRGLLAMDFEAIASSEIIMAKKRYACQLYYDDRFLKEPKKKIVGIEINRSSTPDVAKKALTRLLDIIFTGTNKEASAFIKKLRKVYPLYNINRTALPTSISNLEKFYADRKGSLNDRWIGKGATQTAKASHLHNILLESNSDLGDRFEPVMTGNKLKVLPLKRMMNRDSGYEVIAFKEWLFLKEAGIRPKLVYVDIKESESDLIDYTTLFEKGFLTPATTILEAIGWDVDTDKALIKNLL